MNIPFELHIAIRYLVAKRKQAFISVISLISIIGVTVGVMALVIALALMTGLQREIRDRILGSNPHIYVWNQEGIDDPVAEAAALRKIPRVLGAAPAILGQGLVSASTLTQPAQIKGIDPSLEQEVTDIRSAMQEGDIAALTVPAEGEPDGILLGKDLVAKLGVGVGDSVMVITPQGTLSPMGLIPRTRRFKIAGIFRLGLYEYDSTFGFVSIDVAKRLFDKERPDFIQLRVDDITRAHEVAASVPATLGSKYFTEDWTTMNRPLFSALWLEKVAISMTIGLIVMVAALNIIASLILLVMEKHRDIAILKTMGAGARSVKLIFMMQGLIIGLVGTTAGALAGYGVAFVLDHYELIRVPMDVYQVSHMPLTVLPRDFVIVIVSSLLICFFATIYPARQAARLDPAVALRYE
jgi:lipoprotein-releasing system permease protein